MKISLKGRSVMPGMIRGQAIVSNNSMNLRKCFQKSLFKKANSLVVEDKKSDLYQKNVSSKVLCLLDFEGSSVDDLFVLSMLENSCSAPICILVAKQLPEFVLSGLVLAKNFYKSEIVVVDKLGEEFLSKIENGDIVSICDESVIVE